MEDAYRQHPKAIILRKGSNPCGKVFSKAELEISAGLVQKYGAFAIGDEVYEHIVYKPAEYTYCSNLPGMYERTISCGSLSKTYSITGWRVGYIFAPTHLAAALR
ncbi:aminotransferase class I/II-fold pyridoxal phosphate-dependent enzyme, partial [Megasphaera stantonii]|uniref:aminotransferase class I/II-fold pyridoxal phosphate-dependent enzyme n=1 Tax=Megasphaera stantonii TaxID=2144175 RepID=UPI001E2D7BFC